VQNVLEDWHLHLLTESVLLVLSELVTNAGAPRGALSYPRFNRDELKGGSWA
jgi:hypothetical protein